MEPLNNFMRYSPRDSETKDIGVDIGALDNSIAGEQSYCPRLSLAWPCHVLRYHNDTGGLDDHQDEPGRDKSKGKLLL